VWLTVARHRLNREYRTVKQTLWASRRPMMAPRLAPHRLVQQGSGGREPPRELRRLCPVDCGYGCGRYRESCHVFGTASWES
jgi:hypothetical protein